MPTTSVTFTPNKRKKDQSVWQRGMMKDPNSQSGYYLPLDRLKQLAQEFTQYPGAAPGGSGPTGLMSGDSRGWSDLLERQQEFLQLRARVNNKPGPSIGSAPLRERRYDSQYNLIDPRLPSTAGPGQVPLGQSKAHKTDWEQQMHIDDTKRRHQQALKGLQKVK